MFVSSQISLLEHAADFCEGGAPPLLAPDALPAARSHVRALLARLRPEAVALVEAWDFSDHLRVTAG